MAWTTPLTAVGNAIWTSAQWNSGVRDNLNETATGKATVAGQIFVATGNHTITAFTPQKATVATSQTLTADGTYRDLTTVGPAVSFTKPSGGSMNVTLFFSALVTQSAANVEVFVAPAVSGATTIAADDTKAIRIDGIAASNAVRVFGYARFLNASLTAGSNTFTLKYKAASGTVTIANRFICAVPW